MNTPALTIVDTSSPNDSTAADLNAADVVVHQRSGRQNPLFVIRTWDGEIDNYTALAQILGPDQPLYSIAPPNFETLDAYPHSTQDWVAFLRPRIEAVDHGGDLILAGWSFGGVMALELAESLAILGRNVRRVIMIDTRMPKYRPETKPGVKMPVRLRRLGKHLLEYSAIETRRERLRYAAYRLDPFRKLRKDRARKQRRAEAQKEAHEETQEEAQEKTSAKAHAEADRERGAAHAATAERGATVTRHTGERMSYLKRTIHVAYLKYNRHNTKIPITLLRTQESFKKSGSDPSLGWAAFAQGRFVMDSISGEHDSVFEKAHIPGLARQIRGALLDVPSN